MHFSASFLLPLFVKIIYLMNPYLDPACAGGGFIHWVMHQGTVEASTHVGSEAYLLAQQMDVRLDSVDYMWTAAWVRLEVIPSADETLCNLVTFDLVSLHLFFAVGRHDEAF